MPEAVKLVSLYLGQVFLGLGVVLELAGHKQTSLFDPDPQILFLNEALPI
jgi:hypothetical protein